MCTQHPGLFIVGTKTLPHLPSPNSSCGTKLGDLFKEIVVNIEKETDARSKIVDSDTPLERLLHIVNSVI